MNTTSSRSKHQVACDGIRTIWLPSTPVARETFELLGPRSMDGIVFKGTMGDIATHLHRQDFKQATLSAHKLKIEQPLPSLIASMDGIRARPLAVSVGA